MREVKKESKAKTTTTKVKASATKKETKVKIEKEKKNKVEKGLLNKKDQKNYNVLCQIVYILSKIGRICFMVLLPIVVLSMVFIPIVFRKFEVNANVLKFNDVSIIVRENGVSAKFGDNVYVMNCNTLELDKFMTFLTNNSETSIIIHFEASLLLLSAIIVLVIYILNYVERLFANFMRDKTPFTKENTNYVFKIAVFQLALKIACACFSMIGLFTRCFISVSILSILIMFVVYYLFKYVTIMQEKTDTKICD